jgi:hypothetical protein
MQVALICIRPPALEETAIEQQAVSIDIEYVP